MQAGLDDSVRARASELGFGRVAFSPARLAPRADAFFRWLDQGFAGSMEYLARNPEGRADVTRRSPWARTVVSAAMLYDAAPPPGEAPAAGGLTNLVARYARGPDYHRTLAKKLDELAGFIKTETGGRAETRSLVDTSAILERDHATSGGLGWTGKNTMAILPESGSYFFLGEILTDVEFPQGTPLEDRCGGCTRCIDLCPTGAIVEPYVLDARRCISYLTIEHRGAIPEGQREALGDHLFGCDVCQEVCPWNSHGEAGTAVHFPTIPALEEMSLAEAVAIDAGAFAERFRGSPIKRAGHSGFVRNALIVAGNTQDAEALRSALPRLDDPDPVLRESAVWALKIGPS